MRQGMGMEGFVWWEGVVEDNTDPLAIGRCRVRCFGWDSASKSDIPTEDLPWAYPMLPLNSPSKIFGLKPGTRVLGFFRDGRGAQDRVMLGAINTGENDVKSSYVDIGGGVLGSIMAAAGPAAGLAPMAGSLIEKVPGFSDVTEKVAQSIDQFTELADKVVQQTKDLAESTLESALDVGGEFLEDAAAGVVKAEARARIVEEATTTIRDTIKTSAIDLLDDAPNKILK